MSLVTAAMSSSSRRRLQSCSIRAVLPEPTGPPTPTRNGCLLIGDPLASLASPHPVEGIQNPSERNQSQPEQNQSPAERNPNPAERNPNLTSFHESSLSNGLSPTLTGSPAQIRRDALSSPREQKVNIRLTRLSRKCRLLRKAAPRRSGLPGAVAGISGKEARSRRPCAAL